MLRPAILQVDHEKPNCKLVKVQVLASCGRSTWDNTRGNKSPSFQTRLAMSKDIDVTYFGALKIWHVEIYDYIRCIDQMSLAIAYIHVQ